MLISVVSSSKHTKRRRVIVEEDSDDSSNSEQLEEQVEIKKKRSKYSANLFSNDNLVWLQYLTRLPLLASWQTYPISQRKTRCYFLTKHSYTALIKQ